MSTLSILFPKPEVIELDGKEVSVKPVSLEHFDEYGKAASELIGLMANASVQQINRYAEQHAEDLRRVLGYTTSLSWLARRRLPATAAVQLMVAVIKVNAGFFGEALPGMVAALNGAMSSSD